MSTNTLLTVLRVGESMCSSNCNNKLEIPQSQTQHKVVEKGGLLATLDQIRRERHEQSGQRKHSVSSPSHSNHARTAFIGSHAEVRQPTDPQILTAVRWTVPLTSRTKLKVNHAWI